MTGLLGINTSGDGTAVEAEVAATGDHWGRCVVYSNYLGTIWHVGNKPDHDGDASWTMEINRTTATGVRHAREL